ncbi:MAG: hypothetical protein JRH04_13100 [Deltaproteobacteria bacterium]|nr:hypothetical protein [Deltaproteobacteria bacterium]
MAGKWKEVVRLTFKGERFRDHALDLQALSELSQFQKMVAETAKTLWRAANPDRERLPSHFEERVRLCLRRIEDGSATAPLEVFIEEKDQTAFWEPEPVEINEAVKLAHEVLKDSRGHCCPSMPGGAKALMAMRRWKCKCLRRSQRI